MQPFVLTTENIPDYFIRYLGKEKLDEIDCYAFAVDGLIGASPETLVRSERGEVSARHTGAMSEGALRRLLDAAV